MQNSPIPLLGVPTLHINNSSVHPIDASPDLDLRAVSNLTKTDLSIPPICSMSMKNMSQDSLQLALPKSNQIGLLRLNQVRPLQLNQVSPTQLHLIPHQIPPLQWPLVTWMTHVKQDMLSSFKLPWK